MTDHPRLLLYKNKSAARNGDVVVRKVATPWSKWWDAYIHPNTPLQVTIRGPASFDVAIVYIRIPLEVTKKTLHPLGYYSAVTSAIATEPFRRFRFDIEVDFSIQLLQTSSSIGGPVQPEWDYAIVHYGAQGQRDDFMTAVCNSATGCPQEITFLHTFRVHHFADLTRLYAQSKIVLGAIQVEYESCQLNPTCATDWHTAKGSTNSCRLVGPYETRLQQLAYLNNANIKTLTVYPPDRKSTFVDLTSGWIDDQALHRWPWWCYYIAGLYMAMRPLVQHVYTCLWVIDFIPGMVRWARIGKVRCLEGVEASIRRVLERRELQLKK